MNKEILKEVNIIRNMMGLVNESKYKISKDERIVLSDTDNFLQVLPLTKTASCKYGANTKWCVTGDDERNRFQQYKDRGSDVSMVMIKNPEIVSYFDTGKFAFNIYDGRYLEIHNDKSLYFYDLEKMSKELGIEYEVKGLVDDYINFMKANRGLGDIKNIPFEDL